MAKQNNFYEDDNTDWQERSSFNQAVAYMIRLDYLCKLANYRALEENYTDWFSVLKCLYRELHPRLRKQSGKTEEEQLNTPELKKCKKLLDDLTKINIQYKKVISQSQMLAKAINSSLPSQFSRQLEEFEIYLRDCMNEKGLLLPLPQDPMDNMF